MFLSSEIFISWLLRVKSMTKTSVSVCEKARAVLRNNKTIKFFIAFNL
jgi:hypothetical protein